MLESNPPENRPPESHGIKKQSKVSLLNASLTTSFTVMLLVSITFITLQLLQLLLSCACTSAWKGKLLWKQNLTGEVMSSPALTESKVCLGSNAKGVFCLDRLSGDIAWSFEATKAVKAPGLIAGDILYIGSYDANIYALSLSTGAALWNFTTVSAVRVAPVMGPSQTLFFGSKAGVVYCLNSLTGVVEWSYDTGMDVGHPLIVNNKRVFAASNNQTLYCFKAKNGKKMWQFDTGGEVMTGAVVDGKGKVFIGSASSMLHALHEINGTLIWSYNVTTPLMGELLVKNDMLYLTTDDDILHALRTSNGSHVWSYDSGINKYKVCLLYFILRSVCYFSCILHVQHFIIVILCPDWSYCDGCQWNYIFWCKAERSLRCGWRQGHSAVVLHCPRQSKCCHAYYL